LGCCDTECRPRPPPYPSDPRPIDVDDHSWFDTRYDWKRDNRDTVKPPGLRFKLETLIDLEKTDTEWLCTDIEYVFGLGNETASPEVRLDRCRQLVRAFPEWFLMKGATTSSSD
jgi:hypothetical protein